VYKPNRFTDSGNDIYKIRTVYVNPDFVVCLREDLKTLKMLSEGSLPGLDPRQEFTKVHINGGHGSFDITVVGAPDAVEEQLAQQKSTLLKG